MATERKHQRRQSRGGRLFHLYIILSVLVIAGAIAAGSAVFFKVHRFEVEGNLRYSAEELMEQSGIREGDNLLRIPRAEIAQRMEREMPYLRSVQVKLSPPDRVVLRIEETEPAGAIQSGGSVWYIDSNGKILERVSANESYPVISGLSIVEPEVGKLIQVEEADSLKAKGLRGVLRALEEKELLKKVQSVDVSSASFLTIRYEDRLTVRMGLNDDFHYDLKMLQAAVEGYIAENWSQGDTGTLDMTKREGEAVLSLD